MGNFAAKLRFIWEYWVKGMHRAAPGFPEDDENCPYSPPDERLMKVIGGLYQGHGSIVTRVGPWLTIDNGQLLTRVSYFEHQAPEGYRSVQMDVVTVVVKTREHIIESVGGFGDNLEEALRDAVKNFVESSFHVLIAALLGKTNDQTDIEHWTIGRMRRKVTLGSLYCRGGLPSDEWPPIFEAIENRLSRVGLPPGLHWMRYYYAWIPGGEPVAEVLLDNEIEPELQEHLAQQPWPRGDKFYSRRLFFTIQDA